MPLENSAGRAALIVFAKYPEPGNAKTRLGADLGQAAAAALYEAFVVDSLAGYAMLPADVVLFIPDTEAGRAWASNLLADRVAIQDGEGLGERMANAFKLLFAEGYQRLVIIGTDHPTLPLENVSAALHYLSEPGTVVIGPAEDGGYYLLGLNEPYPQLFIGMEFSHSAVLDETLRRIGKRRLFLLPYWYDVDERGDLDRLCRDVALTERDLPATRAKLRELGLLDAG